MQRTTDAELLLRNERLRRKVVEQNLESTPRPITHEARLDVIFDSPMQGTILWNSEGFITDANDEFLRMIGYSREDVANGRVNWRAMTPPEYQAGDDAAMTELAATGSMKPIEKEFIRKNGSRVPVLASATVLPGVGFGGVAFVFEITEHMRAQKALRVEQERVHLAQQASDSGIWERDLDSDEVYRSQNVATLFGFQCDAHEVHHRDYLAAIHPDDRDRINREIDAGLERGTGFVTEYRVIWPDGTIRWLCDKARIFENGEGRRSRLVGTVRDITDRMQAEESLREAESRYRTIFQGAAEGILVGDIETQRFQFANPVMCKMLGYTEDELTKLGLWDIHPEDSRAQVQAAFEAHVRGDGLRGTRLPCLCKGGAVFNADISTTTVVIDGRRCLVAFFVDITEKQEMEAQLRQSQKMEAIGQLAGGVAHDFNNILAGILGYCDLAQEKLMAGEEVLEELAQVKDCGVRAAELTHQLLAFSRKQPLHPEVLAINDVVGRVDRMLRRVIGEDIALETNLSEGLWKVKADAGQIEQVVLNLAVNARDAMPCGGKLTLTTENIEFSGALARNHPTVTPGRYVMLTMSDTGTGMDEQIKTRVFEPFFTTKDQGKGTGLGLSTVYGIVTQSSGYIRIESQEGQGSTFKILLPFAEEESQAEATGPRDVPRGGGQHILVVEDNDTLRVLMRRMLAKLDYRSTIVADAAEALATIQDGGLTPNLVITDVVMPGMSGTALAEELRRSHPELPVLFMSGYAYRAHGENDEPGDSTHFIQKPFEIAELAAKVDGLMRMVKST